MKRCMTGLLALCMLLGASGALALDYDAVYAGADAYLEALALDDKDPAAIGFDPLTVTGPFFYAAKAGEDSAYYLFGEEERFADAYGAGKAVLLPMEPDWGGVLDAWTPADEPVVFAVVERMKEQKMLGMYGSGFVRAYRYRMTFVDAATGEVVAWLPAASFEENPPSVNAALVSSIGVSTYITDDYNPWQRLIDMLVAAH